MCQQHIELHEEEEEKKKKIHCLLDIPKSDSLKGKCCNRPVEHWKRKRLTMTTIIVMVQVQATWEIKATNFIHKPHLAFACRISQTVNQSDSYVHLAIYLKSTLHVCFWSSKKMANGCKRPEFTTGLNNNNFCLQSELDFVAWKLHQLNLNASSVINFHSNFSLSLFFQLANEWSLSKLRYYQFGCRHH